MCVYCRNNAANSLDHFVPIAKGGEHDFANIVPACKQCNCNKRENMPEEWVIKMFGIERLKYVRSIMLDAYQLVDRALIELDPARP